MYLHSAQIHNIRSIENFEVQWSVEEYAGWHVFLGDNGSGKTTFAKALALAFVGPDEASALRLDWNDWMRRGESFGSVEANINPDWHFDKAAGTGQKLTKFLIPVGVTLGLEGGDEERVLLRETRPSKTFKADRYLWGNKPGWFSAAYGPFRRFSGGDKSYEKLFHINPRLGRHLSVFGEDVALTEATEWLRQLDVDRLRYPEKRALLDDVKDFINQTEFLPHHAKFLDVDNEVIFVDGNNCKIPITQLSDGYRSTLSMTLELLRQLVRCYGEDAVFENVRAGEKTIPVPGVVIVDEIDVHLHPPWQRRIGYWLTQVFPAIQFIVTTHSPLVCQAAERGSVWRLPTPGTKEKGRRVTGTELERLVKGNVLEALDTELFGMDVGRSESGRNELVELAKLNRLATQRALTKSEQKRRGELQAALPTKSNVATNQP